MIMHHWNLIQVPRFINYIIFLVCKCEMYFFWAATYSDLGSDMIGQPLQLDLLVCILLVYIFKFTVILHYLHKLHLHLISPVITWQPFLETNIATAIQHSQTGHNSNRIKSIQTKQSLIIIVAYDVNN